MVNQPFCEWIDVGVLEGGRKKLKKKSISFFYFSHQNKVSYAEVKKICGEIGFHGKKQEFSFVHIKFEMFEKHPHGVVK